MNLAIDGVGAKHSGAATVLLSVVRAALEVSAVERVTVFTSPRSCRNFDLPGDERVRSLEIAWAERGMSARILWHERGLARRLRQERADVVLLLGAGGRSDERIPAVLFVQQALPFSAEAVTGSALRSRLRKRALGWSMGRAARKASAIAVQTATMKASTISTFRLPENRVHVFEPDGTLAVPQKSANPELAEMRSAPANGRYLYVGNSAPYKNLDTVDRAMVLVRRVHSSARLFATVESNYSLAANSAIIPVGYLPARALREAYALATALVMPSLVETVGLPMLEAMRCGTPVIAADRPYARDVCEDAALFFDPLNPADLGRRLLEVSKNGELRRNLSDKGRALEASRVRARGYGRLVDLLVSVAQAKSGS